MQTHQCAFPIIKVRGMATLSAIFYVNASRGAIAVLDVEGWIISLEKIHSVVFIFELGEGIAPAVPYRKSKIKGKQDNRVVIYVYHKTYQLCRRI
jgi:hypothetical protein